MLRKCFLCDCEVEEDQFSCLTPTQIQFLLRGILGIPQWGNALQFEILQQVCYCGECLVKILKLEQRMNKLERLEKKIVQEKAQIKSQLKEGCHQSDRNNSTSESARKPVGMLQKLRQELVKELELEPSYQDLRSNPEILETKVNCSSRTPEGGSQISKMLNVRRKRPRFDSSRNEICPDSEEGVGDDDPSSENSSAVFNKIAEVQERSSSESSEISSARTRRSKTRAKDKIAKTMTTKADILAVSKTNAAQTSRPKPTKKSPKKTPVRERQDFAVDPSSWWMQPKPCEICGKVLSNNRSWKNHVQLLHCAQPKFRCSEPGCDFGCQSQYGLNRHTAGHVNAKEFECEYCIKTFNTEQHLKVHMRIHTGERRYQCQFCSWKFLTSTHKRLHQKNCKPQPTKVKPTATATTAVFS